MPARGRAHRVLQDSGGITDPDLRLRKKESAIRHTQVQNAFVESFNSKLRDECLNEHVFFTLAEARETIEAWRYDYNQLRPHGSLGALTPTEFAMLKGQQEQPPVAPQNLVHAD